MDTSARLSGHGLLREGKPWARLGDEWMEVRCGRYGRGRCSCGDSSPVLNSDAGRKRWHRDHKDKIRSDREARHA
jgi:hypothetical protein